VTVAKLTPTQKGLLLRRARAGASTRELAAEFGMSQSFVAKLVRSNTPPDPKSVAIAKLHAIIEDESLPAGVRLQAAEALKTTLDPDAATEQPAKRKPIVFPANSPWAADDDWKDPFEGCKETPVPPPAPKPTPADLRAKEVERGNELMRRAVEEGNVAAIERLNELFRKQGQYADTVPVSQKPAEPMPPPDHAWIERRQLLLACAVLRNDAERIAELRGELDRHGIDYPGRPKPEPAPARERPEAPWPNMNERAMALQAKRVQPVGSRVVDWEEYRDSF
jgi:transcriptional regulator with XRE-family HTH domain